MILNLLVGCFGTLAVSLKHDYIDHDANHDDKHVFGERGWGTKACEDIASAYWNQEPSVSGDRWYVKTRGGTYECGGCSAGCTGAGSKYQVQYNLSGLDNCPTRFLSEIQQNPFDCDAVPEEDQNGQPYKRAINIAVYGSSHSRVLFLHMWRLLAGERWGDPLPPEMLTEAQGGNGALGGYQVYSFDFCESRMHVNIVFHYKRYFLSTANDNQFLRVLSEINMTELDLLITEESIWSRYEAEMLGKNSRRNTYMRAIGEPTAPDGWILASVDPRTEWGEGWNVTSAFEEEYYLDWLVQHFSSRRTDTIIAVGSSESPDQKAAETADFMTRVAAESARNPQWKACVLDKRILTRPPGGMVCGHGCDGPVPAIQAQAILRSINGVLKRG